MSRVRKIDRHPTKHRRNYFLVDACFLANKYIPIKRAPEDHEKERIRQCMLWWREIDNQVTRDVARVYIPDLCIAETFKVLAKKYYVEHWFPNPAELKTARERCLKDITTDTKTLKKPTRKIGYHDVPTCRDLIIAVDRFYEVFMKEGKSVQIADLLLVATAKYLMDFYDIPKRQLHIITLDVALWSGTKKIQELPNAYDPTNPKDGFERIFERKKRKPKRRIQATS